MGPFAKCSGPVVDWVNGIEDKIRRRVMGPWRLSWPVQRPDDRPIRPFEMSSSGHLLELALIPSYRRRAKIAAVKRIPRAPLSLRSIPLQPSQVRIPREGESSVVLGGYYVVEQPPWAQIWQLERSTGMTSLSEAATISRGHRTNRVCPSSISCASVWPGRRAFYCERGSGDPRGPPTHGRSVAVARKQPETNDRKPLQRN